MNWAKEGWCCFSKITKPHVPGPLSFQGNAVAKNNCPMIMSRRFGSKAINLGNEADRQLTREFLMKLWVADREKGNHPKEKQQRKLENRYSIVDVCYPQSPVGFIHEERNVLARQLLCLRWPFVAYITDALGDELSRVPSPFGGYQAQFMQKLMVRNKQFAMVENPGLWNWTFTLKDINGEVQAQIDRDWRGFGFEIFIDAGQYVIRFGGSDPGFKIGLAAVVQDLEVSRPLTLPERAVAVALAISLDNDYFSRHGGWGLPLIAIGE